MLPFFQSPAVKIHAQAPNDTSLQQVFSFTPFSPFLLEMFFASAVSRFFFSLPTFLVSKQAALFNQMQFPGPSVVNSSNRNTNPNGFSATNVAAAAAAVAPLMAPSSFLNCPNILPVVQNNRLSVFAQQHVQFGATQHLNQQLLALQLLGISCGMPQNAQQFQGQLQNLNMFTPLPPGVGPFSVNNRPQNFNFIGGLPNGQICFPTTMMHRNQIADLNSPASSCLGSNKPEHLGNHPMVAVGTHASLCNGALCTGGKKISFTHEGKHESLVNPKKLHQPNIWSPTKNHHPMKYNQPGNLWPQVAITSTTLPFKLYNAWIWETCLKL